MIRAWRLLLLVIGILSLALGMAGIFLPLLPTTPFILLSAACAAKASPRFHHWLHSHPTFGPLLKNWATHRAMPRRAKWLSAIMMSISVLMLAWRMPQYPWLILSVAMVCLTVGIWLWRLPDI